MTSTVATEIRRIDRSVTAFLDEWTVRTKRLHAVGDSLKQLEQLAAGQDAPQSPTERLNALSAWLNEHGEAVVGAGVRRSDLEILVVVAEQLVSLRAEGEAQAGGPEQQRLGEIVDRLVKLIRRGTALLGLEYTPAGLVEVPKENAEESNRVRHSLLQRLQGFEDVKSAYLKALEFQKERLAYFYQDETHLLTVLDYQLKNLEARPSREDEFFAACLLYFLKQHNYQTTPYMQRFQKIVASQPDIPLWEQRQA